MPGAHLPSILAKEKPVLSLSEQYLSTFIVCLSAILLADLLWKLTSRHPQPPLQGARAYLQLEFVKNLQRQYVHCSLDAAMVELVVMLIENDIRVTPGNLEQLCELVLQGLQRLRFAFVSDVLVVLRETIPRYNRLPFFDEMQEVYHERKVILQGNVREAIRKKDQAIREKDQAIREKDQAIREKDQANREKDQANMEMDQAIREKDQANREKDQANMEMDQANMEKDQATREKDQANREKDQANMEKDQANREKDQANMEMEKAEAWAIEAESDVTEANFRISRAKETLHAKEKKLDILMVELKVSQEKAIQLNEAKILFARKCDENEMLKTEIKNLKKK